MSGPTIESIELTHHSLLLNPPFAAAWDPTPRTRFPVTLVRVTASDGSVGIGTGDDLYELQSHTHLFIGERVDDLERHHTIIDNISFHGTRLWPLEVALWDLAGKVSDTPVWQMMGGQSDKLRLYASMGVLKTPSDTAATGRVLVEQGFEAVKLRFGSEDLDTDLARLGALRDAVGPDIQIMVDCNQGWRMPWDTSPAWTLTQARDVARELAAFNVYWMEEPLHRGDYHGMRSLRSDELVRIAGGEMNREAHEFQALLAFECLDVYQPDVYCTLGLGGFKALARDVADAGLVLSPHTWGAGISVVANLHAIAGTGTSEFVEYPMDPPDWTPARWGFMLENPPLPDGSGHLTLSDEPGLGMTLDTEALDRATSYDGSWH